MKEKYWDVTDEQVKDKTGKSLGHWMGVLKKFGAHEKKSTESVTHLQQEHNVPRYWARTLTTRYLKSLGEKAGN